jgi:CheY-like chemotaxis protein
VFWVAMVSAQILGSGRQRSLSPGGSGGRRGCDGVTYVLAMLTERVMEGNRRVLVVDNEVETARGLADIVALEGYEARAAYDGAAALRLAAEYRPEVVLLDLGLPGIDGYAVARMMRVVLGERARLVAITGFAEDPVRLRDAGFDAYLIKPLALTALLGLLGGPAAA